MLELSPTTDTHLPSGGSHSLTSPAQGLRVQRRREEGASSSLPCNGPGESADLGAGKSPGATNSLHPPCLSFLTCTVTLPGSGSKIKYSSLPASVSPQRKASAPGRRRTR